MPPSLKGLSSFFKKATPPKLPLTKKIFPKGMLPARGGTNPGKSLLANRPGGAPAIKPPAPRLPSIPVRDTKGFPPTKEGRRDLAPMKPAPRTISSTLPAATPAQKQASQSYGQQTVSAAEKRARETAARQREQDRAASANRARVEAEKQSSQKYKTVAEGGGLKTPLPTSSRAQIDKLEVDRRVALAKKRAGVSTPTPRSIQSLLGQKPATKRVVPELSSVFHSRGEQGDKFTKGYVVGKQTRGQTGVAGSYVPGIKSEAEARRIAKEWNEQNAYRAPVLRGPAPIKYKGFQPPSQLLSAEEAKIVKLISSGQSDTKIRAAMGIDQNAAHRLLNSARDKMGITARDSIRDAAKQRGIK